LLIAAVSAMGWAPADARAESTLRIGMTAADIPLTTTRPHVARPSGGHVV
jgi:hypothetical protein